MASPLVLGGWAREGRLPGRFVVGDTKQSLPRLSSSLALGAFFFVIRGSRLFAIGT